MDPVNIGHDVTVFWMGQGIGIYWKHGNDCLWNSLKFYPHYESTGHRLISGSEMDKSNFTVEGILVCSQCGFKGQVKNGCWKLS